MKHLICLLSIFTLAVVCGADESGPEKPNIVIMMADDMGLGDTSVYLGKSLGPNSGPITRTLRTPNLEDFANHTQRNSLGDYAVPDRIAGTRIKGESRYTDGAVAGDREDMVLENDAVFGELLKTLRETDDPRWPGHQMIENTLLIFTSDNGPNTGDNLGSNQESGGLRGKKAKIWEGGIRVPMIIYWSGHIEGGKINRNVCSLTDLYATLAKVVGHSLVPNEAHDSLDSLAYWTGENDSPDKRARVFFCHLGPPWSNDVLAIRKGSEKLLVDDGWHNLRNDIDGAIGFEFRLREDRVATHLGMWDDHSKDAPARPARNVPTEHDRDRPTLDEGNKGGLVAPHTVRLHETESSGGVKLVVRLDLPVGSKGEWENEFRYFPLPASVLLSKGKVYRLTMSTSAGDGDHFHDPAGFDGLPPLIHPTVEVLRSVLIRNDDQRLPVAIPAFADMNEAYSAHRFPVGPTLRGCNEITSPICLSFRCSAALNLSSDSPLSSAKLALRNIENTAHLVQFISLQPLRFETPSK